MKLYNLICIIRLSKDGNRSHLTKYLPRAPDMEIRHDDVGFARAHHAMISPRTAEAFNPNFNSNLTEATGVINQR